MKKSQNLVAESKPARAVSALKECTVSVGVAGGKQPVFGMLKRDDKVYTQIVKNCLASELLPILREFSELDESVIYSDNWKAYDGLADYGAKASCHENTAKTSLQIGETYQRN